jgi:hypothetical protein
MLRPIGRDMPIPYSTDVYSPVQNIVRRKVLNEKGIGKLAGSVWQPKWLVRNRAGRTIITVLLR